ncbi:hypothetical protein [Photobacterium leiognathi]|nr:hypothetical protein [Photobacterium leiognathi]
MNNWIVLAFLSIFIIGCAHSMSEGTSIQAHGNVEMSRSIH